MMFSFCISSLLVNIFVKFKLQFVFLRLKSKLIRLILLSKKMKILS